MTGWFKFTVIGAGGGGGSGSWVNNGSNLYSGGGCRDDQVGVFGGDGGGGETNADETNYDAGTASGDSFVWFEYFDPTL